MDRAKTMERLRKRAEFLAVAGGARASRRGFLLQMRAPSAEDGTRPARFGFTVTKKMGNSPERNRIRRRLREAVRLSATPHALPGADYVLVGRRAALSQPFEFLVTDLISGLADLAGSKTPRRTRRGASHPDETARRHPGPSDLTPKDPPDDR
jgi:ribonuclease P protein component